MNDVIIRLVTALFGTIGFAILFRVHPKRLPFAALGGMLTYAVFEALELWVGIPLVSGFGSSLFIALYSEILARRLRAPAIIFVLPCAIPIVPGGSLYYTVYNLIFYNFDEFAYHGKRMTGIILGMAVGMSMASILIGAALQIINTIKRPQSKTE